MLPVTLMLPQWPKGRPATRQPHNETLLSISDHGNLPWMAQLLEDECLDGFETGSEASDCNNSGQSPLLEVA